MIINRTGAFIIVVLVVSWIVQAIVFGSILPGQYLPIYMYAPALIAFIFFLFHKQPVKTQVALFTRPTTLWPWVFAIIYPFFLFGLVILAALITGLGKFNTGFLPALLSWPFISVFVLAVIISLPTFLGEEYGWRGYLLPQLAEGKGKLWATIITGLVWGLWHIPSYYIIYSKAGMGNPILLTALGVAVVAIGAFPYTYAFFLSGNIIPCVVLHAFYDLCATQIFFGNPALPGLSEGSPGLLIIHWPYAQLLILAVGTALACIFAWQFNRQANDKMVK
jgi:membrane protease YdiL (CAAX protease family)